MVPRAAGRTTRRQAATDLVSIDPESAPRCRVGHRSSQGGVQLYREHNLPKKLQHNSAKRNSFFRPPGDSASVCNLVGVEQQAKGEVGRDARN